MTGMKRIALMGSVAALPLLLASGAYAQQSAGSIGMAGQTVASVDQEAQVAGQGAFPGSILIPGTNTSLKIGGYAKLDVVKDFGENTGEFGFLNSLSPSNARNPITGNPTDQPGTFGPDVRKGAFQMGAKQSRFNIETRTPSAFGTVKTYLEGDFYGASPTANNVVTNGTAFEIRHFYGELGPWLAGHTWTTIMDLEANPETLDFNGAIGQLFIRQSQVRYTATFGNTTWMGAIEEPESDFVGNGGLNSSIANNNSGFVVGPAGTAVGLSASSVAGQVSPNARQVAPDFTTRITTHQSFGEISGYGVVRIIDEKTFPTTIASVSTVTGGAAENTVGNTAASTVGWLIGSSGAFQMSSIIPALGKDKLQYMANYAEGGQRYIFYLGGLSTEFNPAENGGAGGLTALRAESGFMYYQHWWADTLRSNFGGGYLRNFTHNDFIGGVGSATAAAITKYGQGGHVNLIWSPVPNTNVGIEAYYLRRGFQNGTKGEAERLQSSFQVLF